MQYVQDYDERYPETALAGNGMIGWAGAIYPYVKDLAVYRCPSDATTHFSGSWESSRWHPVSYAANNDITEPVYSGAYANTPGAGALSSFNAPAKTVLLLEVTQSGGMVDLGELNPTNNATYYSPGSWGGPVALTAIAGKSAGWYDTGFMGGRGGTLATNPGSSDAVDASSNSNAGWYRYSTGRHLEGSNFLLADGHVKWLKGEAVSTGFNALTTTDQQDNASPGPHADGTEYSGALAHAVTFSTR
jgi:prepilin-type processing-associated H-X9-DG protein